MKLWLMLVRPIPFSRIVSWKLRGGIVNVLFMNVEQHNEHMYWREHKYKLHLYFVERVWLELDVKTVHL